VSPLSALFDAYRRRARISFRYRGDARRLDPYGILFRDGHWYAVGFDPDRGEARSFRADRIEGSVESGPAGSFQRPGEFDPSTALRNEPWRFGDEEPVEALVLIDPSQAAWVTADLGPDSVAERRADGSVVVRLLVTNRAALRSFVLDLLDAAEVLGPPDLRADMATWLEALSEAG
jgi:predicted DNA-binding transcriptional regulator YafY